MLLNYGKQTNKQTKNNKPVCSLPLAGSLGFIDLSNTVFVQGETVFSVCMGLFREQKKKKTKKQISFSSKKKKKEQNYLLAKDETKRKKKILFTHSVLITDNKDMHSE